MDEQWTPCELDCEKNRPCRYKMDCKDGYDLLPRHGLRRSQKRALADYFDSLFLGIKETPRSRGKGRDVNPRKLILEGDWP